jgi:hypothetical protein
MREDLAAGDVKKRDRRERIWRRETMGLLLGNVIFYDVTGLLVKDTFFPNKNGHR